MGLSGSCGSERNDFNLLTQQCQLLPDYHWRVAEHLSNDNSFLHGLLLSEEKKKDEDVRMKDALHL